MWGENEWVNQGTGAKVGAIRLRFSCCHWRQGGRPSPLLTNKLLLSRDPGPVTRLGWGVRMQNGVRSSLQVLALTSKEGARRGEINALKWEGSSLWTGPHGHPSPPSSALGGLQTAKPERAGLSPEQPSDTKVSGTVPTRSPGLTLRLHSSSLTVTLPHSDSGTTLASGSLLRRWKVISEFQYLPRGPVIDFLNTQLLDAVVEAFLPQASWRRWNGSEGPRTNVNFHSISREDVASLSARELLSWGLSLG